MPHLPGGKGREVGWRATWIMAWMPTSPPSTCWTSACQVVRCSASERGSCLASRVSSLACWARAIASTADGARSVIGLKLRGQLTLPGFDRQAAG